MEAQAGRQAGRQAGTKAVGVRVHRRQHVRSGRFLLSSPVSNEIITYLHLSLTCLLRPCRPRCLRLAPAVGECEILYTRHARAGSCLLILCWSVWLLVLAPVGASPMWMCIGKPADA